MLGFSVDCIKPLRPQCWSYKDTETSAPITVKTLSNKTGRSINWTADLALTLRMSDSEDSTGT